MTTVSLETLEQYRKPLTSRDLGDIQRAEGGSRRERDQAFHKDPIRASYRQRIHEEHQLEYSRGMARHRGQ